MRNLIALHYCTFGLGQDPGVFLVPGTMSSGGVNFTCEVMSFLDNKKSPKLVVSRFHGLGISPIADRIPG